MRTELRTKLIKSLFSEELQILKAKGKSYSGDEDALKNFKENGARLGLSKYQILMIYLMEHIDSILNAIKDNPEQPVDESEGLTSRILDARNYLGILYCLMIEDDEDFEESDLIITNDLIRQDLANCIDGKEVPNKLLQKSEIVRNYYLELNIHMNEIWKLFIVQYCRENIDDYKIRFTLPLVEILEANSPELEDYLAAIKLLRKFIDHIRNTTTIIGDYEQLIVDDWNAICSKYTEQLNLERYKNSVDKYPVPTIMNLMEL